MTGLDHREDEAVAGVHVAPLAIHKQPASQASRATSRAASRTASRTSLHRRRSSSRSRRTVSSIRSHGHMSPPLTPLATTHDMDTLHPEPEAVFHNYLRAYYHFHPSSTVTSTAQESSVTVPINQGDVILVHSIHPNGWADGTLLGSGARGWLPTNYCHAYDHPSIRSLLQGLTHLWDMVKSFEDGNRVVFTKQDYVRAMIAGVRLLLEKSGCLTRDSELVTANVGIRRMRKGLLGDLSSLVKTAKQLQTLLMTPDDDSLPENVIELLDELVLRAFKVATRAVRFLDIWSQDQGASEQVEPAELLELAERPPTPPRDDGERSHSGEDGATETDAVSRPLLATPTDEIPDFASAANITPRSRATFGVFTASMQSLAPISPSQSIHPKRISISHRASYSVGPQRQHLASQRLSAAQDAFLGSIASFIGLHLQSRSSLELRTTTEQAVVACRQLLSVVGEVWDRDSRRSEPLAQARDAMQERLNDLVLATKQMFGSNNAAGDEFTPTPYQGRELVAAATGCVKAAGDCAGKAKFVIEKIGDFEFERSPSISHTIFEGLNFGEAAQPPQADTATTVPTEDAKPLPSPPKPTKTPPPPPIIVAEDKPLPPPPMSASSQDDTSTIAGQLDSPLASPMTASFPKYRETISSLDGLPVPDFPLPSRHSLEQAPRALSKDGAIESFNSDTTSTYPSSVRGSGASVMSHTSTRATTPEDQSLSPRTDPQRLGSFASMADMRSTHSEDCYGVEDQMLEKTYAHELIYNKDGQIAGGSLQALVEQLTAHEATPDAMFVTAFYLTFRLFTTPLEFAQSLIERFTYVGDHPSIALPVRLRVHNVFKGWMESHWHPETDSAALGVILTFATGKLRQALPKAGQRLAELTARASTVHAGTFVPRLLSSQGKTSTSSTVYTPTEATVPNPIISKSQLNLLRNFRTSPCSILDFDTMELARQLTIIESKLYCSIHPDELLASEWMKKEKTKAVNVRAMSKLSTDLANLVADSILQLEDAKKRAVIIKQWVKVSMKCLELNNYDSLFAIVCSLNSSMVQRLKRTWELVNAKTKSRFEELKAITGVERNYATLRKRLENHVAPCIPFVGMYLTDLTFVDIGNNATRQLPDSEGVTLINFDKHMRTARIIGQLQRFQVPYALATIPEMQDWMQAQIERVREIDQNNNVQHLYRRSLLLEPREMQAMKASPIEGSGAFSSKSSESKEKFDFSAAFHIMPRRNTESRVPSPPGTAVGSPPARP